MACLHQAVGGTAAWHKLAEVFYSRVARDPRLRPLFPGKTLHCAIEELTAFLVQFSGGPSGDSQRRWWLSLRESHQRFKIGLEERAAWMENMVGALDDARIEEPLRGALLEFFQRSSAYVVNTGEAAPQAVDSGPHRDDAIRQEIAQRWDAQLALDEAAAAIRGDAERAIALADGAMLRARFQSDPSTLAGLLALMMRGRHPKLIRYAATKMKDHPDLVRERYAGRTLLHEAASQGLSGIVALLLRLGADPNANDGGSHTPLYAVANECRSPEGASVVAILVEAGANVNVNDGVKRCTPLHMAARRGNVEIAGALLDHGADIEARDSVGDTPLRRSVNCNKTNVASFLLSRGADTFSIGSKGLTPLRAARTEAMKQLLALRTAR